ncbi:MAG: ATP-dependent 6-phosphofructokinase [Labilithrix sp.]|nr:ATP-dependent 6-phosphofructokinase [Labilithrix sp.]
MPVVSHPVTSIGPRDVPSPLGLSTGEDAEGPRYVPDDAFVLRTIEGRASSPLGVEALEKAGPRERIHFTPSRVRAAILTAGGLCPGINNVIRALVLELVYRYGVREVLGLPLGFAGLGPSARPPIALGPDEVRHIHTRGGTILGTSRGAQPVAGMVDALIARGVDVLFTIGGDGTLRGAHAIAAEIAERGAKIAVVAIPKTIDNDIPHVDKTFGFETAVSMARAAIDAAHTEATSALGGVGLVKTMGRDAGFIAAHASLASVDVNVCLVPEVGFELHGPHGLLAHVERRLETRGHAVIVVAEGCGAILAGADPVRDPSGNMAYGADAVDIGRHLKSAIEKHLDGRRLPHSVKYIDPSYMIRGVAAGAIDSIFCADLARAAVHAAMAGKTDVMIGRLHRAFTHVPLPLALAERKRIDPRGELWLSVMESTGQPRLSAR